MRRIWRWFVALVALLFGWLVRRKSSEDGEQGRIVAEGPPDRGAENLVLVLLGIAILFAAGFIVAYAEYGVGPLPTELLGICLGGCLLFVGAALAAVAKRLIVTEELEDEYPQPHEREQEEVAEIVRESGSRITRKRLLLGAGAAAGGALGAALLTPAASLGPLWYTAPLDRSPWRRGSRVVDENGRPYAADEIEAGTFYTAFPERATKEDLGSSVVVVRLDPGGLQLPPERATWAPQGIVAYSKICTHAGCAIALYRKPTFPVLEPHDALVCPCHYSTFDPARAGAVIYGPAGRPLPQLPLLIDDTGTLRSGGNFSGPVGPSWWGVRDSKAE